jgi:ABC-type nitrate/sulfonate/bicarbonate transport system permease component
LALWEAATWIFSIPTWMLPAPSRIAQEFVSGFPGLVDDIGVTVSLTLVGFAVGTVFGVLIATIMHLVGPVREAVYPLLILSQNVPTIALAPLLVIWFGFGDLPKIIVIVLMCFFPVAIATMDGLRGADRVILDYLKMSGAKRSTIFTTLEVPGALPSFFSGLKIAATYAVMSSVIAEWVGSDKGLGHYMLLQKSAFRADRMFVSIIIVIALSLLLFALIVAAERRFTRWRSPRDN